MHHEHEARSGPESEGARSENHNSGLVPTDPRANAVESTTRPENGLGGLDPRGLRSYLPKATLLPPTAAQGAQPEGANQAMQAPQAATNAAALAAFSGISITPLRAVSYLRVSTLRQARRGGGDIEGFSLPAQREANRNKAMTLGAVVVKEFTDGGQSGTSMKRRNDLADLLEYLDTHEVDFVIVHKLDRLARNGDDDSDITRALRGRNVRLISTTEPIDETPAGMLLHRILAGMNEFYSRNLSIEVLKGMTMKARTGGTNGKAPLGYRNIQYADNDGREVRTVVLDEERSPLVRWAFEEYANGQMSLKELAQSLNAQGLRTMATPKRPSKEISEPTLHGILTNPYYRGVVVFQGVEAPGRHIPLVDDNTFERVQAILASRRYGERKRVNDHFLKTTLVCGKCGSRMIVQITKARSGDIYPYFVCLGRARKATDCDFKAVLIHLVEEAVEDVYDRLYTQLSPEFRRELEAAIEGEFASERDYAEQARQHLNVERDKLEREQQKLLQAHYADAIPLELMKSEQDRIGRNLRENLRQAEFLRTDLERIEAILHLALDLIENCSRAYRLAEPHVKKLFNQVFFERLEVLDDDTVTAQLAEPFSTLLRQSHSVVRTDASRKTKSGTSPKGHPAQSTAPHSERRRHSPFFAWIVSDKPSLVDPRRFELLTSSMRTKRATNCAKGP